jgi:[ribosomal protein S5]-alanine N-acetyltransferase
MFELLTPRLRLRDLVEADAETIYALSQAPEVVRFQHWLLLDTLDEAQDWMRRAMRHNALAPRYAYNLAVREREGEKSIGWLGWGQVDDRSQPVHSFGYALLPAFWNRGYMTEALQAAAHFLFERLGAELLYATCDARNRASARVMEHLGMTLVAEWQELNEHTNEPEQHWRYELRVQEWRAQNGSNGESQ